LSGIFFVVRSNKLLAISTAILMLSIVFLVCTPENVPANYHDAPEWDEFPSYAVPATELPARYDLRDVNGVCYVTSVKDQGRNGTCWAFSTLAAVESAAISAGVADTSVDLSELQFAYFTFFGEGEDGDHLVKIRDSDYLSSGYDNSSINFLANWWGPVPEDAVSTPYQDATSETVVDGSLQYADSLHLTGFYMVNFHDQSSVKYLVSSCHTPIIFSMNYRRSSCIYIESEGTHVYYNDDASKYDGGHQMIVVGWDDNYPAENFGNSGLTKNGAWLVKNSWGDSDHYIGKAWPGDGYMWVSYENAGFIANSFMPIVGAASDCSNIYQYDCGLSPNMNVTFGNTGHEANIFVAERNETLSAVSFFLCRNTGVDYTVQVYLNPADASDPTSGKALFSDTVKGTTTFAGYYSVDVPDVHLSEGDRFAVVIELKSGDGRDLYMPLDTSEIYFDKYNGRYAGSRIAESLAYASAGQSYVSQNGDDWNDLSADGHTNLRIKAFTSDA
jgi:C1A family cysteine protease